MVRPAAARLRGGSYTFPYVRLHGRYYPLVPVRLTRRGLVVNTFGLLDSGASLSVFRPEIAQALGLAKKKSSMRLGTAGGGVNIAVHRVQLGVGETVFPMRIGFSDGFAATFNIIGREDFFRQFAICFNERRREFVLKPFRR